MPSLVPGLPPTMVRVFAHGEGDELGSVDENRQASIATSARAASANADPPEPVPASDACGCWP
jgi:hypothetical protein